MPLEIEERKPKERKPKEHSTIDKVGCGKLKPDRNPVSYRATFLQATSMNASEGKKFP